MSIAQMVQATANDVHPPLYYLILILFTRIFGQHYWVYRLVSVIPYLTIVIFTLIVIKKRFGNAVTVLFLTYISISQPAVAYNVEARMYSLACAFVLLSFYGLLLILERKKAGYIIFVVASLGAAYSHYYALFAVSFFYLALLVQTIKGKEKLLRFVIVCITTISGYLSWLLSMISTFQRTSEDFWMTKYPKIIDCMKYFYQSDKDWYSIGMLVVTIFSVVVVACKCVGLFEIKNEDNKKVISIFSDLKELNPVSTWSV